MNYEGIAFIHRHPIGGSPPMSSVGCLRRGECLDWSWALQRNDGGAALLVLVAGPPTGRRTACSSAPMLLACTALLTTRRAESGSTVEILWLHLVCGCWRFCVWAAGSWGRGSQSRFSSASFWQGRHLLRSEAWTHVCSRMRFHRSGSIPQLIRCESGSSPEHVC